MGKLTNLKIKNAKPQNKTYKLSDGDNLYLLSLQDIKCGCSDTAFREN